MNEQHAPNGIEWTRIRQSDGTRTRGFTWNVIGGCKHACEWEMPDGKVAECYAKTVAERVAQRAYPQGFAHHYFHPERLNEPLKLKEGAGVFLDSMADLMGHWVPDEEVEMVLDICRQASQHTFFLLTKNAPRLLQYEFPDNVWVGVSSPPDWMFGKRLSRQQQEKMLTRTLDVLSQVKAKIRWISAEPLSWDCSAIFRKYPDAIQWVVIGAASNGKTEYPPAEDDVLNLLDVMDDYSIPVFFKGNMKTLPIFLDDWRDEFPDDLYVPRRYQGYATPAPDYEWGNSEPYIPDPVKHGTHTITIYTARIDCGDPDALNATVKSAETPEGKLLAPRWDMVNGHKSGLLTDEAYTEAYLQLLRGRYGQNPQPFHHLLQRHDRLVITCYCAAGNFCHRHLAVDVLEKIGERIGVKVIRGGEIEKPQTETAQLALF